MIVTKFGYPLDANLVKKLDIMVRRVHQPNPKRDAVLLCEGAEGEGKTTLSVAIAFYVAEQTGRKFNHENVFFDLQPMIKFLQENEGQIAIWDEPALQALSMDYASAVVKDLTRLLMMARKKRHFIIINLAYFNKFSDYIVWQRPLGMCHVYSRNELEAGRFCYIKKKALEGLYNEWKRNHKRNYRRWSSKNIRGTFPDVLNKDYKNNVLSVFDNASYERQKDNAINMIGTKDTNKDKAKLEKYLTIIAQLPLEVRRQVAEKAGIDLDTINKWKERYTPHISPTDSTTDIINIGDRGLGENVAV